MRKPYPLYLDLISLISESDFNQQRWLHFPWFRHAGTRRVRPRDRRGVRLAGTTVTILATSTSIDTCVEVTDELSQLRAVASRERADRALPVSPQMALFAAAA